MACKYVKDFSFDASQGYTGSASKPVKMAFGGALLAGKVGQAAKQAAASIPASPTPTPPQPPAPPPRQGGFLGAVNNKFKEAANQLAVRQAVGNAAQGVKRSMVGGFKKGGKVLEKETGERYPSKAAMVKHEKTETPRMQREELVQKQVVRGPAMAAGRDPRIPMFKCGGKAKK